MYEVAKVVDGNVNNLFSIVGISHSVYSLSIKVH